MKITKKQLRKIVKEELSNLLLEYEQYVYRTHEGELRIRDDEGDEAAPHLESSYGWIAPGESVETRRSRSSVGGRSQPRRLRDKDIVDLDLRGRR